MPPDILQFAPEPPVALLAATEVEITPSKYNAPVQAKAKKTLPNQNSPVSAVGGMPCWTAPKHEH